MARNGTSRLLRAINRSAILEILRQRSPISRSQLAKVSNISLPTVMRIVDDLIEERLVRETGKKRMGPGRPASLVEFDGQAFAIVGIDLGGTKLYGTVADLSGTVQHSLYRTHEENQAQTNGDYLAGLRRFIERLLEMPRPDGQQIRGIGVGAPGVTIVPEGIVTWAPSLGWRDLPLQEHLRDYFELPVIVENDVNLAALGEWGFGAGKGSSSMVAMTLGTGIGAGIIIDGAIYRGFNQAAGEIGYMIPSVNYLGRSYEGFGALEMLASGSGIAALGETLRREAGLSQPGEKIDAPFVFACSKAGESWAQQVLDETAEYLALAIANLSTILNPELVVIGGGVASSAYPMLERIRERLQGVIPYAPRLELSQLGREAAVMGAIMLVTKATDDYVVVKQL